MICYRKKNKLLTSIILRILPQDPKIRRNPLSIKFFQVISPLDIVNYPYYNFTITRYNQFAWRKSRYQYSSGSDQISKVEENFPDIEEISWLISTRREERIHFCEISFFYKIPECQVPRILAKKSCGTFIFPSRSVFLF